LERVEQKVGGILVPKRHSLPLFRIGVAMLGCVVIERV
jgi:hypothetical protein